MTIDPIEDLLKDPDRRAKIYLIAAGLMIVSTILITVGTIIFIISVLGII
ncbi:MAG: hypothetical protein KO217_05255 [Methanobacteriaceae archaeon]|jgi:hypothetical protein|nr:hypothetical protein [Methanobacteriaceae archaeon]